MTRSKDDVTIEWLGGKPVAILRWEGIEFHEELDPIIFEFSEEKQKYWFRKALVQLEKQLKHAMSNRIVQL